MARVSPSNIFFIVGLAATITAVELASADGRCDVESLAAEIVKSCNMESVPAPATVRCYTAVIRAAFNGKSDSVAQSPSSSSRMRRRLMS